MPGNEAIKVGIGLIERGGFYLIRRRPPLPGSPMPGVWEFPGGKCEPAETPAQAAERECREEVGLEVVIGRLRRTTTHEYAHGLIEIHYFDAKLKVESDEPGHDTGFVWISVSELKNHTFPPANDLIIADLISS